MIALFLNGGLVMWPLLAVAVGILWISLRTAACLHRAAPPLDEIGKSLQSLLFWGVMSVLLGALGTVAGLVLMAQAIHLSRAVESPLMWGGVRLSLVSLGFGLLSFLFAATAWLALRQWSLRAAEHPGATPD